MVYFTGIKKTKHYTEEHEQNVPWSEVIEVIFKSSKNIRKKEGKYEIETDKYYIENFEYPYNCQNSLREL